MLRQSLKPSEQGIQRLTKALKYNRQSKSALANELGVARDTVRKFFAGQPVLSENFVKICEALGVDWQKVVEQPKDTESKPVEADQDNSSDIEILVQEVCEKIKPSIQERCGTMRVLDMTQPIELNDIYINVNILEKITGRRRLGIDELMKQGFDPESQDFDRFGLSKISEQRVEGLKAVNEHTKLLILGKPGAGKTTFLKYLAIQCIGGEFKANLVPVFILLRQFTETHNQSDLLEFILQIFANFGVSNYQTHKLLNHGRLLILLDGLDEVREEDSHRVLKQIQDFLDNFYKNQFVLTCRIAANQYTFVNFTEVEVADFDDDQISDFAYKWFKAKEAEQKAYKLVKKLGENEPIKELATNPLLLTLLCLVFEETSEFYSPNRIDLYKEGIDILLTKWDAKRNIERHQIYKKLSLKKKRDLLSYIAFETFERGSYFFMQKELEQYITNYIRHLPDVKSDPEALQLDSEAVLKSIEAQHGLLVERAKGIYSFSHLTFQEYFAARRITYFSDPQESDKALRGLVKQITEGRWREVFVLAVGMMESADYLLQLMKKQIDEIVAQDEKLQKFLKWVDEQSLLGQNSIQSQFSCKPAAIRAIYLDLDFHFDPNRTLGCLLDFDCTCVFTCALFLTRVLNLADVALGLHKALKLSPDLICNRTLEPALAMTLERALAIDNILDESDIEIELRQELQQLQEQLPDRNSDEEKLRRWWKSCGQSWADQVRDVIIKYRRLSIDWKFSELQKKKLKEYYDANLLLIECLNSCYAHDEVRQEIENTLLLPINEMSD